MNWLRSIRPLPLVCAAILLADPLMAENFVGAKTSRIVPEKPRTTLQLGERLRYEVSWMGVPVGFGDAEVKERVVIDGREAFHIIAVARTNEFLSKIYPVEDEVHSWVDTQTLYPLKFKKILREGRYRADEEVRFDSAGGKGFYQSFLNGTSKEFSLPGPVHDIVSAFYWARMQSIELGKSAQTLVNSEEDNWDLKVKALEVLYKEIRGLGRVPTILIEPTTQLKGALYSRGRVWVYLSADEARTPVWIVFKTPFGPVNGVLKKAFSS